MHNEFPSLHALDACWQRLLFYLYVPFASKQLKVFCSELHILTLLDMIIIA